MFFDGNDPRYWNSEGRDVRDVTTTQQQPRQEDIKLMMTWVNAQHCLPLNESKAEEVIAQGHKISWSKAKQEVEAWSQTAQNHQAGSHFGRTRYVVTLTGVYWCYNTRSFWVYRTRVWSTYMLTMWQSFRKDPCSASLLTAANYEHQTRFQKER